MRGISPEVARETIPSSEYTIWSAHFDNEFKRCDRLSYEFGLLRMTLHEVFCEKVPDLEKCMLASRIKDKEKPLDMMNWEEHEEAMKQIKREGRMLLGR